MTNSYGKMYWRMEHDHQKEQAEKYRKKYIDRMAEIDEYRNTIRNIDALTDSVRFTPFEDKPSTDMVIDKIVRIIVELEGKVGEIT